MSCRRPRQARVRMFSLPRLIASALFALLVSVAAQAAGPDPKVLRVCADPRSPPLSDSAGGGYENRIAELVGSDLGLPVEYVWMPQRMGFIRNTLRAADGRGGFRCDIVMGVPADYEMTATTRPYLHSSWVMVLADRPELAAVRSADDLLRLPPDILARLRFGAFTKTQPLDWLFKHELYGQTTVYQTLSGDPDEFPGQIVSGDLVDGKIDIALVWGPIGGYFAKQAKAPLRVVALSSTPQFKFDYLLSFGVRHPDKAWRDRLDGVIARRQADIDRILDDYGVPRLELPPPPPASGAKS
jgi:quinoprotein dehydrogenase-associated probable ABC transporter substrate-binding protein